MGKMNDSQAFEAKVSALLSGFREKLPRSTDKLVVRGVKMTVAGVHDRLEAIARAREAVRKAKLHYEQALRALRETEEDDLKFHDALVHYLRQRFGRDPVQIKPFGLEVV